MCCWQIPKLFGAVIGGSPALTGGDLVMTGTAVAGAALAAASMGAGAIAGVAGAGALVLAALPEAHLQQPGPPPRLALEPPGRRLQAQSLQWDLRLRPGAQRRALLHRVLLYGRRQARPLASVAAKASIHRSTEPRQTETGPEQQEVRALSLQVMRSKIWGHRPWRVPDLSRSVQPADLPLQASPKACHLQRAALKQRTT